VDALASPLDNPPWAALTTAHRDLAQGGPLAVRYLPDVAPFAAVAERTEACFAALAALMPPESRVALQTFDRLVPPPPFTVERQAPLFQMVMESATLVEPSPEPAHVVLGADDVPEMIDLTGRTQPGPFGPRTIDLGRYIGIREDGALAAMAGERMRFGRFVEISAVCTDPAFRGRGLATLLMIRLARRIQDQGMVPILHVFESNTAAIALYERIGFAKRHAFFITVMRAESPG
jgi:predicted GNAT family acetyltransferase